MPVLPLVLSFIAQLAAGGPLDELIARDSAVVVAGRLASVAPATAPDSGPSFTLEVVRVLKPASGEDMLPTLDLVAAFWPIGLGLPLEAGTEVVAVLSRDATAEAGYSLEPHVRAIVPISIAGLPAEIAPATLGAAIAENVLRGADASVVMDPVIRAGRIQLAAETLSPDQRHLLAPSLASREAWVRRAAIGASFRVGPTASDLDAAAKDFRRFLAAPQAEVPLPSGARYSPLHLFLESYAEVERAAVVNRDLGRCTLFLPLYRVIVDENDVVDPFGNERTFYRERIGLAGLAIAGTEDDLARLHSFTNSETPATRQRALDAIARILGLDAVPADEREFAAREAEIQESATEALRARGIPVAERKTTEPRPRRTEEPR
jgi:hypothetical protein